MSHLDAVLARHSAFNSFAALLDTSPGYVPTLNLAEAPSLYPVAVAMVEAGRDAYLVTKTGARVFASALQYKAPEVLEAEFGITVPAPKPRRLSGTVFSAFGETWKATGGKSRDFNALGRGIVARRWNRSRGAFNKNPVTLRVSRAFVFENEVEATKKESK